MYRSNEALGVSNESLATPIATMGRPIVALGAYDGPLSRCGERMERRGEAFYLPNAFFLAASNSSPGFHEGRVGLSAIERTARKPRRVSSIMPS